MTDKIPARLHKKEPLTIVYDKQTVYLTGAVFIIVLFLIAFGIGGENINYLIGGCV